ncbi:MAG: response regulator [Planctomycetes bacterium]|nr:response regulator [Planctomycetota bacterium]
MLAKKILFIDDDVKRITSHIEMLEMEGYKVQSELSVQNARLEFMKNPTEYSLIILDIMMPVDDFTREETKFGRETGLVLLEKLRDISKKIPIIILTVLRDPRAVEKAKKLGVNEYLLKPQLPTNLIELVRKYLGK